VTLRTAPVGHSLHELPSTPQLRFEFDCSSDAPARARAAVGRYFRGDPLRSDLTLTASELVTNVLRHTGNRGALEVYDGDAVVVAVHDWDPMPPTRREPGAHGGFGIAIVSAIADAWGMECTKLGKSVWAVFERARDRRTT
jgi:anti-sigma regulatory factor (Ser/Thr protein kinase)